MQVSVIIPTYHSWENLIHCLDALKKQTFNKEKFEIIVVNNDPNDPIPSNLDLPVNACIIEESKPSSYAARNAGIKESSGEILAFTDSDCIPAEDWLEKGVKFLEENEDTSRVAGHIELTYQDEDEVTMAELYEKEFAFKQEDGGAATANLIAYRKVFNEVGLFNDEMKSGGDTEWAKRAEQQNFKSKYADNVIVYHPARTSLIDLCQKAIRVYPGWFKVKGYQNRSFVFKIFYGIYLLRPPLKMIYDLFGRYKFHSILKIVCVEYIRRLTNVYSHYQLIFTGKEKRS